VMSEMEQNLDPLCCDTLCCVVARPLLRKLIIFFINTKIAACTQGSRCS
jgi:hypothetical protein